METKIIEWIVNQNVKAQKPKNYSHRNSHAREARRLKYCKQCKRVWENDCTGAFLSYDNMPTYKLPRKTCKKCIKNNERQI